MPRRPTATSRWLTALTWPVGVTLTSWDYMWRSTPLHRREVAEAAAPPHLPPEYPSGVDDAEVQGAETGRGALFHRRYQIRIREAELNAPSLMAKLKTDLNQAAPTEFARFQKVRGEAGEFAVGDEYVVRMPGPWDGPVRVIAEDPRSFRLATLKGHLEAGQIEFRTSDTADGRVKVTIESWARSSGRFSDLLYHHVGMAKEIQLHMWVSFLEGVVGIARGRITGGIDIDTRSVEDPFPA
jgi:hypothetical protein